MGKSLLFAYWQTLVRDKRDAQKLKKERQRLTIGQSYAAKFAMQADSTTMRAIIIEWSCEQGMRPASSFGNRESKAGCRSKGHDSIDASCICAETRSRDRQ